MTIENLETGEQVTYQIVGEDEANLKHNKISVHSPIARSLIGKETGDIVELETPSGSKELEILKIEY